MVREDESSKVDRANLRQRGRSVSISVKNITKTIRQLSGRSTT